MGSPQSFKLKYKSRNCNKFCQVYGNWTWITYNETELTSPCSGNQRQSRQTKYYKMGLCWPINFIDKLAKDGKKTILNTKQQLRSMHLLLLTSSRKTPFSVWRDLCVEQGSSWLCSIWKTNQKRTRSVLIKRKTNFDIPRSCYRLQHSRNCHILETVK